MRSASTILLAIATLIAPATAAAQTYTISTLAGGALPVNIPGASASLFGPQSTFTIDPSGNLFFVDGNTVLRLDATSGIITLIAGNGTAGYSGDNGPAVSAQLHNPYGIALDAAGNLYIACFYDNVVREVSNGVITTIVGTGAPGFSGDSGPAVSARLNAPYGIALDTNGNLYISDAGNSRIREVSGGVITTIAGTDTSGFFGDNGPATGAELNAPRSLALDSASNLYIADSGNNRIRKVAGGVIGTVAGTGVAGFSGDNGPAVNAQLDVPCGLALDSAGNLYIAEYYNNRIRKLANGVITTFAGKGTQGFSGDGGPAVAAQLDDPFVLAIDSTGNLFIGDYGNNRIRKVAVSGTISTVAGNGTTGFSGDGGSAVSAQLHTPYGIALDSAGNIYTADYQNNRIRLISNSLIGTFAGTGVAGFSGDSGPANVAQLNNPLAVALDSPGNIYIADFGNNRIRKVSGGTITTVAGNGTAGFAGDNAAATSAALNGPSGVAPDTTGNLYIADSANNRIRKVSVSGTITTVAGNGTPGFSGDTAAATSAQLNIPSAVTVDATGNLYIADSGNNRIRKVSGGIITTVAGNGTAGFTGDNAAATSARLNSPGALAVTSNGTIYIADTYNNAIRKIAAGVITTIAGGGASFGDNGPATAADLAAPQGVGFDPSGNIYIADTLDNRIRLLTPLPLSVASPSILPPGTVGTSYDPVTFTAMGGSGSYTWSATGLPVGLTISTAGILGGTPNVAASVAPQFTVKDSALSSVSITLPLTVSFPVPVITTTSPASATASGAAFTLTVNGTGFLAGNTIQWNSTTLVTRLVSSNQLTASIAATLIAAPGSATISVSSGGGISNSLAFSINAPTPTLTKMTPTSAVATGAAFTLTATGTAFVSASQLEWNGSPLQTTFVSATQLTATVPAGLIASEGTAAVVANSGGASSSALTFTVTPAPAITGVNPASVVAYGPAFTLTVNGTGFAAGAAVQWNNTALATKVVSPTQLTASVPATQIGGAGSVNVVVTSGGVSSNAFAFPLTPPPPVITSLSPKSTIATGAAFTLTLNGTGFTQDSTTEWNGTALPTTFVSATQLTSYVAANLIVTAGTASITVSSGGTTSAAVTFTITAAPAITTLSPAAVVAGAAAFTLTVNGTGFVSGAQVQWNGANLPTTFVSATQLTAAVPSNLVASTSSVTVAVSYAGASSNGVTFPINGPPGITSLSPTSATAGAAAFTLTVTGTGFVSGATVAWNGAALSTKFVSVTQLTASVTANLIASAGVATITVSSGGSATGSLQFPINAPPVISGLSPATVAGTGAPFTLSVTGTGFSSGTTVQWNGTSLTTTYVNATQLTAAVPANLAAGTGNASIVAMNPGGAASVAAKLAITAAKPAVTAGGIVPVYSTSSVIQPGSWVSIYGSGLGNGTYTWKGDFPTTLGGTSVKINNKSAYLWFVSPTQINLQAPDDSTTGTVNVVVTTGAGTITSTVILAPYGPSFSLVPASNYAAAVIPTTAGYDLAGPPGQFTFVTRPVRAGEILELYGVGFGPTKSPVAAGKAFSGSSLTANPVTIAIGGKNAQVLFSGITESGVYQFNIIVPNVGSGDQPMLATVQAVQSPSNVLVSIQ